MHYILLSHFYLEDIECVYTMDGTDYTGAMNTTVSGKACIPWTYEQLEAFVGYLEIGGSHFPIENYCRNYRFDNAFTAPWCFTGPNSWEFCHVDKCG